MQALVHCCSNPGRLLDISQNLAILPQIIAQKAALPFSIHLASLASRRDYLNLDKWVSERILSNPADASQFARACLSFLLTEANSAQGFTAFQNAFKNLPPRSMYVFLLLPVMPKLLRISPA